MQRSVILGGEVAKSTNISTIELFSKVVTVESWVKLDLQNVSTLQINETLADTCVREMEQR